MKKVAIAIAAGLIALTPVAASADGYYKRHHNQRHHHSNNNGAYIAGGIIGGLLLGGIIANQNQYQGVPRGYGEYYHNPYPRECVTRKYQVWDPYRQAWLWQSRTDCY